MAKEVRPKTPTARVTDHLLQLERERERERERDFPIGPLRNFHPNMLSLLSKLV